MNNTLYIILMAISILIALSGGFLYALKNTVLRDHTKSPGENQTGLIIFLIGLALIMFVGYIGVHTDKQTEFKSAIEKGYAFYIDGSETPMAADELKEYGDYYRIEIYDEKQTVWIRSEK